MLLIVDDGKFEMQTIVEELELSGFEVVWKTDVDAALTFLKRNTQQVDLLILDIMMPAGRAFRDEDTQDGLRTGFHFYERARAMAPHLPIVMFTNFPNERIMEQYRRENCFIFRKVDYLPYELVEQVQAILAAARPNTTPGEER
jgi:CheY-like chemotaxis protein